jgi:hypothetical protein
MTFAASVSFPTNPRTDDRRFVMGAVVVVDAMRAGGDSR